MTAAQAEHRRSLTVADRDAKAQGEARGKSLARARNAFQAREVKRVQGVQARLRQEFYARRAAGAGA